MGNGIRIGIIGLGYMGNIHLSKIINKRDVILAAVYDIDREKYGCVKNNKKVICCNNFEKFAGIVDAVIISSPSTTHSRYLRYFLKRGIHCLCEKPPALSTTQLIDLLQISKKEGAIFNVVMPERANPVVKRIIERVAMNGFAFFSDRVAPFSTRSIDISVLFDLMIHDIDILMHIIPYRISRISAGGISLVTGDIDLLNVRIEYENSGFAILNASRTAVEKKRSIRLFYKGGYFSVDLMKRKYHSISISNGRLLSEIKDLSRASADPIEEIDADFIHSIKNQDLSSYSARTLLPVMRICDRIQRRIARLSTSELLDLSFIR